MNRNERGCVIVDIIGDIKVSQKEKEKIEGYQELKKEIKRMWNIRSIKGCLHYIFASLFCLSKKEDFSRNKNVYYFTSKALLVLEMIRF